MSLAIRETYVNETEGYVFGDSEWYETWTDDIGSLFRDLQREYGRCISKMYVGNGHQTGWVFEKRMNYEDARPSWPRDRRSYLQQTWVEVSTELPRQVTTIEGVVHPW